MAEQMKEIREMLEKDQILRRAVRGAVLEILEEGAVDVLDLLEDPKHNLEVMKLLQEVARKIAKVGDDTLDSHYEMMCRFTGVPLADVELEGVRDDEVVLDLRPISGEFATTGTRPSSTGKVPVARMTGSFEFNRAGGRKEVVVVPTRMKYIKEGSITMEICVDDGSLPKILKGEVIYLVRDSEKVRVRITNVLRHEDLSSLLNDDGVLLQKWLPRMAQSDLEVVAGRMFDSSRVGDRSLLVFEFEVL